MLTVFALAMSVAQAHVIGISQWCLSTSPVHFECFFENEDRCQAYMKKLKDPFTKYSCEERPTDPAIISAPDLKPPTGPLKAQ